MMKTINLTIQRSTEYFTNLAPKKELTKAVMEIVGSFISSYKNDAMKLWNNCPETITKCTSVYSAKKAIKAFTKNLPI